MSLEHSPVRQRKQTDSIAGDLLHGAKQISKFLGITERQVFYYVEQGHLPHTKLGNLIIASKTALRRHFIPVSES